MTVKDEIIIIGGGIIGLAIAVELKQLGAKVSIISRNFQEAAGLAAAGMLAPQAEEIPPSPLLDLCLLSRQLYPEWIKEIENITSVNTGYWPCGIIAPRYHRPMIVSEDWQESVKISQLQTGLTPEIAGGYWYPEDGSIDNVALTNALKLATNILNIPIHENITVKHWEISDHKITHLITDQGEIRGDRYILAAGAWSGQLLPIPVKPKKGQMLSLINPHHPDQILQKVLFGEEIYIVPRKDGRIILGATSEDVGFTTGNTEAGIQQLWARAIRLFPPLKDWEINSQWWGFRPCTPDESPLLGDSPYQNLTLATGHHRNGILLAPITAKLISRQVGEETVDELVSKFSWQRFLGMDDTDKFFK
jgi:glycine oxidase ThiO